MGRAGDWLGLSPGQFYGGNFAGLDPGGGRRGTNLQQSAPVPAPKLGQKEYHGPGPVAVGSVGKQRRRGAWSRRQWQGLEGPLLQLHHTEQPRQQWRSLIAQEVLCDPQLLALVRLCGVREMIAFALGAFIGDIQRFAGPKKLVKYVG